VSISTRQDLLTNFEAGNSKVPHPPTTPKIPIKTDAPQKPALNATVTQCPIQKGKGIEIPEIPKQTNPNLIASTSNSGATVGSSLVGTTPAISSGSSILASSNGRTPLNRTIKTPNSLAPSIAAKISDLNYEIFRLAAATPVPISPTVERQFYESQLLLYVLEKVRGEHKKRQNYHGELDQGETELRRSFVDKLAYICDFKKGGSTVTALALQKTYQGVTFWIGANETIKPKVIGFLQQILQVLKNVDSTSRETTETQLLALIVPFNKVRLDYYWSAVKRNLPLCIERLDNLEGSAGKLFIKVTLSQLTNLDAKPSSKELKVLKNLLSGLLKLSKTRVDLVRECFEARKRKLSAFETLAQLTASGNAYSKFFDDIRHLLGRLGEHLKAIKTIVSAALRFPAILDGFEIKARASPPAKCYFQSSHSITLDGIASRIFTKDDEIIHYQEALETLQRTSDGALLDCLQQECLFKTRIHAELLLADFFYWNQFDFVGDDPYIGCSKPACFNCFQYILAHPGNFVLPACHNKLYLVWRSPDVIDDKVPVEFASKIREAITSKMNSSIRAELRRQIDGRYAKKAAQYDSVTGTSSSIQVGHILQPPASTSEDGEDSTYASAQESLPSRGCSPFKYLDTVSSEIGKFFILSFIEVRLCDTHTWSL
jgi:hypothetical protein